MGHFRETQKNNCTANPNCTGHVVDYPCSWNPVTEQQLFWNDIKMESENNGTHYSGGSLKEIFYAANATQSDIMALWWKPDPSFDQFDYIKVAFPFPTSECIENRRPKVDRCTANQTELVGNKEGACDLAVLPLEKFLATSLQENAFNTPVDTRSPAYQFATSFTFQNIQVEEVLQNWYQRNIDKYGYDPREAVCEYIGKNLGKYQTVSQTDQLCIFRELNSVCLSVDAMMAFVPPGYPRQIGATKDIDYYEDPLPIVSLVFAAVSSFTMLLTFIATVYYREHKVMKSAQIAFLYFFCLGYLFVSLGALLHGVKPSDGVCVAREWLVIFGYTVALVPLAVKVTAINQLLRHARMMRRHEISQNQLLLVSAVLVTAVVIFLTVWTVIDPPTMSIDVVLRDGSSDVVDALILCSSDRLFWGGVALGWEGILIFYSFVLAWQARRQMKMKKISELQMVRNMAYVSFMVFVFRSVVFYLPLDAILPQTRSGAESILWSIDCMLSILVYFGPKFFLIKSNTREEHVYESFRMQPGGSHMVECPDCKKKFQAPPSLHDSFFDESVRANLTSSHRHISEKGFSNGEEQSLVKPSQNDDPTSGVFSSAIPNNTAHTVNEEAGKHVSFQPDEEGSLAEA